MAMASWQAARNILPPAVPLPFTTIISSCGQSLLLLGAPQKAGKARIYIHRSATITESNGRAGSGARAVMTAWSSRKSRSRSASRPATTIKATSNSASNGRQQKRRRSATMQPARAQPRLPRSYLCRFIYYIGESAAVAFERQRRYAQPRCGLQEGRLDQRAQSAWCRHVQESPKQREQKLWPTGFWCYYR